MSSFAAIFYIAKKDLTSVRRSCSIQIMNSTKQRFDRQIGVPVTDDLYRRVAAIAADHEWPVAQMARKLILEALAERDKLKEAA